MIMGPCAGGAVYSPAMTDFIFMVSIMSWGSRSNDRGVREESDCDGHTSHQARTCTTSCIHTIQHTHIDTHTMCNAIQHYTTLFYFIQFYSKWFNPMQSSGEKDVVHVRNGAQCGEDSDSRNSHTGGAGWSTCPFLCIRQVCALRYCTALHLAALYCAALHSPYHLAIYCILPNIVLFNKLTCCAFLALV